ncbi:MAG: GldG family protein [Candidatus Rokubacteria bacterium]|nr:GldG family protein [Candidatus Rokubacteria bacterium]
MSPPAASSDLLNTGWFGVVLGALVVLFAAGVRLPAGRAGWRRWLARVLVVTGAATVALLANIAIFRHDVHVDVTRERAYTPSPEARRVVESLTTDVDLTYFYQKQNPAGNAAKTMVEIMGRANPRLRVRTVDPDQHPGLASRLGVRAYNVAVLENGDRRIQVLSTEDRDIALGILRVTRASVKTICFAVGHGEYDIDNFEYHTHFEGVHAHGHGAEGAAVVLMEQHGVGRLRRALDSLGFATRKVALATAGRIPDECAAVVEANPRTLYTPPESGVLADYLGRGGAALLMYDIDFPVERKLAALLERAGVRVLDGVVVDPLDHYFTDEQMVAVARYATHPITRGAALSFYPGVRPLEAVPTPGVTAMPLFASSAESYVRPAGAAARAGAARAGRGPRSLAVAAEGTLPGVPVPRPFRLVVVGDGDFASNSFFPYMSNSDLVLGMLAWLVREERGPTMKPPVEVLPTVVLTEQQVRLIFVVTVIVLPGAVVGAGGAVWWWRRR